MKRAIHILFGYDLGEFWSYTPDGDVITEHTVIEAKYVRFQ